MKTILIATCMTLACITLVHAEVTNVVNLTKMSRAERAKFKQILKSYEGGKIRKPGSAAGSIVIVNAQDVAKQEWLNECMSNINARLFYEISIQRGEFNWPNPKIVGNATLFVINDPKLPSLLSAPENRWALVNVAGLSGGNGAKQQFFEARVKKELTRGFCLLAGSQDSNYKCSLMGCKTQPEQLDTHPDCALPIDVINRFKPYLAGYGIKPWTITTYRKACREGWAPQPTNELQKTVWDDVHAIPANPLKVTFDPATQKGKVTK